MSLRGTKQSLRVLIGKNSYEIINVVFVFNGINELPLVGCLRRTSSQ
jgi:hypothetical protein